MNVLPLSPEEKITVALPVHDFDEGKYLIMITRKGRIKRVELGVFASVRPSGLIAVNLEPGDSLGWVKMTRGEQDIILISQQGKGIRFNEEDVRPMGRAAAGVNAMRLDPWDALAGADAVSYTHLHRRLRLPCAKPGTRPVSVNYSITVQPTDR